uniref:Putative secreted protein n=1 Tax=Anopheles marajoara TaxID=58244 RepID=A0A2M4CFK6_9DIPT
MGVALVAWGLSASVPLPPPPPLAPVASISILYGIAVAAGAELRRVSLGGGAGGQLSGSSSSSGISL